MGEARVRVVWSEVATRDLEDIVVFLAQRSPVDAERLLVRLRRRAAALLRFPRRGRIVSELSLLGITAWREVVSYPYRIIYRLAAREVRVLAVLDGRRDLEDVLLERLART